MPTYEYACTSCGEHVEVVQSFRDEPLTVCPACSGPLRKVFGSIGVVFKGNGFYKTDSRTSGAASSKPEPVKSDASGSSATKSDSTKSDSSKSDSSGSSPAKPSSGNDSSGAGPASTGSGSQSSEGSSSGGKGAAAAS
ncbi:MAG: FmdB family zinc ribbon protein [Acidimicrobiales bacterium]